MNNPALMSAAMQQSQRVMGAPFAMGQPAQMPTTTSFAPVPAQPTLTASDQLAAAEARFTAELDQLHAMGFTDRRRNVRALLAAGGNVDAAVNFLLG